MFTTNITPTESMDCLGNHILNHLYNGVNSFRSSVLDIFINLSETKKEFLGEIKYLKKLKEVDLG